MRTRQKRVATDTWRSLGCPTTPLEHWSKRKPTVEPRWTKQQTKKLRPQPTKINTFFFGAIIESVARPTGVQLKREAKLLTVIGLNTKHADCRIIFMLSYTFVTYDNFFLTDQKNQPYLQCFWIYILSHHKIPVPIGLGASDFKSNFQDRENTSKSGIFEMLPSW